jgi:hypothetical protein
VTLGAIQAAAAALGTMPQRPEVAMEILSSLCVAHHVDR